jgi:predicted kinase
MLLKRPSLHKDSERIMARKPLLIIVNGLPGSGKTTLSKRLAGDVGLPVFARDSVYEALYDALACDSNGRPPLLGSASFALLYHVAGTVLSAGNPLIIEGFFGRSDERSAELLRLRHTCDFEPFQIICKADGRVLLERFLARAVSGDRHPGHRDMDWLEHNEERLLLGQLAPLAVGGQIVEIDTTTPQHFSYSYVLQRVQAALSDTLV